MNTFDKTIVFCRLPSICSSIYVFTYIPIYKMHILPSDVNAQFYLHFLYLYSNEFGNVETFVIQRSLWVFMDSYL